MEYGGRAFFVGILGFECLKYTYDVFDACSETEIGLISYYCYYYIPALSCLLSDRGGFWTLTV